MSIFLEYKYFILILIIVYLCKTIKVLLNDNLNQPFEQVIFAKDIATLLLDNFNHKKWENIFDFDDHLQNMKYDWLNRDFKL